MKKVAIVTDSTAYLPQSYVDEYGISIVPLSFTWDGVNYRDGIDMSPDEFYTRLSTSHSLPVTSQPSMGEFSAVFQKLLDEDYAILTLPISSGISGTINSALQAKDLFKDAPIEIIDTKLVSMPLAFQVLTAARAAREGASLEDCKQLALAAYPHIGVYFVVDDLKYLHAGGRIGGGKRFLGTALRIKPILEIRDGKIEAVKSAITMQKGIDAMIELVKANIADQKPVRISVFHALAEEKAKALLDRLVQQFSPVEAILSYVSPVIGTHVGPGTLSIAYMAGM